MPARIRVLAGVNGAGKSSIGGVALRSAGADYYNPDEITRSLVTRGASLAEANGRAWAVGRKLLERAITHNLNFAFETTLGGRTITRLLLEAGSSGHEVFVWYVGLAGAELHVARVRARVRDGGHDIPEALIRERYERSRLNLIALLPSLSELRLFDNSAETPPASEPPQPRLLLHLERSAIVGPPDLTATPEWARPIVAAALRLRR